MAMDVDVVCEMVYDENITENAKKFTKFLHHLIFVVLLVVSVPLIIEVSRIVICLFLTSCCGMFSECCKYFLKNFGFKVD